MPLVETGTPRSGVSVATGDTLGRYRLLRAIGEGGMGAVFEAVHDDIGRRVAIKVLQPALAARAVARERFFREARAAARVHHPGVVQVHDVDVDAGTAYLVMDLLVGETLAHRLERGPIPPEELLTLMGPALDGVACAHDAGVIHRDLKPSNLFLARTPDGDRAVVVDFGVSRLVDEDSDLTGSHAMLGTPAFMSPEQARGTRDVGAASDQFSLGAVLYNCLSGRRPFDGQNPLEIAWHIQRGEREPLARVAPTASPALVAVIDRAMAQRPSERFPSVRDFVAALRRALVEPAVKPPRRRVRVIAAAVTALVASALAWGTYRANVAPRPSPAPPGSAVTMEAPRSSALAAPPPPAVVAAAFAPAPTVITAHAPTRLAPRARPAPRAPLRVEAAPAPAAPPEPAVALAPAAPALGRNRALILGR